MEENLDGFRAIRAGKCFDCRGPLFDDSGTCSERHVSVSGTSAFAAAICNKCKRDLRAVRASWCGDRPTELEGDYICKLKPNHKGKHIYEEVDPT